MRKMLQEFAIKSLVIGPRGECSADLHELVRKCGEVTAERTWRKTGARNVSEAKASITEGMYRRLGIAAVLANARMKRERLGIAFSDGARVAATRNASNAAHLNQQHEYEYYHAGMFGDGYSR